jgi:arginine decarboxylase
MDQTQAPLYCALSAIRDERIVPFDVPGHKRGRGNPALTEFLGERCLSVDVNSMKPLDNLCHPVSVIRDAEALAAEAFGASHAFFMVGGTTSSVQAMILSTLKSGEQIILPRNVHQSVLNALVLCGALPVYVNPETDSRLGISLGMSPASVLSAMETHPDAKAVLLNNPTYYGICSDICTITHLAHARGLRVLADEAHGTHFYFSDDMPVSAMAAGADMSAVSLHKSGGSLTQSSMLLCGANVNADYVRQVINLTQTTSGSYLLLSSLDISRRNLALHGPELFSRVLRFARYAREEINQLGDYYAFSKELVNSESVFDFDETKLSINTLALGLAGIEIYDILRDRYGIQTEFGDLGNILAYLSVGDKAKNIERLITALSDIHRLDKRERRGLMESEYLPPEVVLSPQKAFYACKTSLPLSQCAGLVSGEFVMSYPPGIPILAPGERISSDIVEYIRYAKSKGCLLTGPESMDVSRLNVVTREENVNG